MTIKSNIVKKEERNINNMQNNLASMIKEKKLFLLDIDGTVALGSELLPGAADFLQTVRAGSLLHGHGCPRCAGVKLKSHAEFVKDLKSLRDDVVITGRYVKALEKTKFRFSKCGHECDITPAHVLSGRGCPECGRSQKGASQRLTMEIFLERLHKIDPNLVVSEGAMYINNHTLMPLHCNACGYEYQIRPHDVLNQRGCPNCHRSCTSFLEQFIYHSFAHILGESKVMSREKTVIGVELDIYVPDLKVAVEPGSWHWHKNMVAKDWEKHLLCKDKGIKLITIYSNT